LADGLEQIVEQHQLFHVSGPEKDRLTVGFEKNGSNFRLFASAKDGVLSGHALVAATSQTHQAKKTAFHISNTSAANTYW